MAYNPERCLLSEDPEKHGVIKARTALLNNLYFIVQKIPYEFPDSADGYNTLNISHPVCLTCSLCYTECSPVVSYDHIKNRFEIYPIQISR